VFFGKLHKFAAAPITILLQDDVEQGRRKKKVGVRMVLELDL
jgi:hypothetical protein